MKIFNVSHSYASIALAAVVAFGVGFSGTMMASAQTMNGTIMPALYNAAGMEVNMNNTPLAAGYYFLAPNAQSTSQVYYNGDGTFVNQSTGLYAGSVSNPNGTAGVALVYGTRATGSVGAPNTGAGGDAAMVWTTLVATGLIAAAGASYLVINRKRVTVAL